MCDGRMRGRLLNCMKLESLISSAFRDLLRSQGKGVSRLYLKEFKEEKKNSEENLIQTIIQLINSSSFSCNVILWIFCL